MDEIDAALDFKNVSIVAFYIYVSIIANNWTWWYIKFMLALYKNFKKVFYSFWHMSRKAYTRVSY